MNRLRPTIATANGSRVDATQLAELASSRVHVDVVVPRTEIRGRMRLVSRSELFTVHAETRQFLSDHGFPVDATAVSALGAIDQWNYEAGARTLAIAVRDPKNEALALAPVEGWRDCDDDQIAALWRQYHDLEERLNPLGAGVELTEQEQATMIEAAKKKDLAMLMSFGSQKLASFALISAEQQSS